MVLPKEEVRFTMKYYAAFPYEEGHGYHFGWSKAITGDLLYIIRQ